MNPTYLLSFIAESLWAIRPEKLAQICELAVRHAYGARATAEELADLRAARRDPAPRAAGAVAVLPIYGTIIPRGDMILESSGAISAARISAMLRAALADPDVAEIVLDIDSPGGSVQGIEELASEIYNARGRKPITAVSDYTMASAAYWLGSQADEIVASPSSLTGSIGVYAAHEDISRALDMAGVKITLVSEGKYKTEGHPFEPLTDEARGSIQAMIAPYYASFTKAVARGRGVAVSEVREGFGEGRILGAAAAKAAGLVDRIDTLESVIAGATRSARRGLSADDRARRLRLAARGVEVS